MKLNRLMAIDENYHSRLVLQPNGCPIRGYASVHKIIEPYINEDCVVAYYSSPMGIIVLIRGKKKFFAFTANVYGGHLSRQQLKKIIPTLNAYGEIVDKQLWKRVCTEEMKI